MAGQGWTGYNNYPTNKENELSNFMTKMEMSKTLCVILCSIILPFVLVEWCWWSDMCEGHLFQPQSGLQNETCCLLIF